MKDHKSVLGWREWVCLPHLHIDAIKAKVDTGAKTSALHAYFIHPYLRADGETWLRFGIHPLQRSVELAVECHAKLVDQRNVTDSGGHREMRYVIETPLMVGAKTFRSQLTLTDRENMRFRMLLGRNALRRRFLVDAEKSYLLGEDPAKVYPLTSRVNEK